MRFLPPSLQPYWIRIAATLLGFIVGILMLTIGFWRTLLLVLLTLGGYLLGKLLDGSLNTSRIPLLNRWR